MKENATQKEFRLMMNDLLSTDVRLTHNIEIKNLYKDYPCSGCGAENNAKGKTCWRYKATSIKEKFYGQLTSPTETEDRVKSNIAEAMQTLEKCKCKFVSETENFKKVNGHLIGCKYSKHD